jgi:hypothetical protein
LAFSHVLLLAGFFGQRPPVFSLLFNRLLLPGRRFKLANTHFKKMFRESLLHGQHAIRLRDNRANEFQQSNLDLLRDSIELHCMSKATASMIVSSITNRRFIMITLASQMQQYHCRFTQLLESAE